MANLTAKASARYVRSSYGKRGLRRSVPKLPITSIPRSLPVRLPDSVQSVDVIQQTLVREVKHREYLFAYLGLYRASSLRSDLMQDGGKLEIKRSLTI